MNKFSDDTPLDSVVKSESKYLSQVDLPDDSLVLTMNGFSQEETQGFDGKSETLTLMHFLGDHKPMVIKPTNRDILKELGFKTAGDCRAREITVWIDHTVKYAGRKVGGLRLRAAPVPMAPKEQHPNAVPRQELAPDPVQPPGDDFPDSDIPF